MTLRKPARVATDSTSPWRIPCALLRWLSLGVATLSIASCVASETPLIRDATPTMGRQFTAQLFRGFADGRAHELKAATYRWQDGAYVNVGGAVDLRRFVSMPLEGDDAIIQGSDTGGRIFTYWIKRKLADGTYLILPLDEADADAATRTAACATGKPEGYCFIDTREHLIALAEATARSPVKDAELAVLVGDGFKPTSEILNVRR